MLTAYPARRSCEVSLTKKLLAIPSHSSSRTTLAEAAVNYKPTEHPSVNDPSISMIKRTVLKAFFAVLDMLRRPAYLIPFLLNITGSVWFFLLIGQAELSLTVPIVNSLAFLFTVVGEWWAEGKVISRGWTASSHVPVPANEISDTWLGMSFVLSGIGLCVYSKS